MAERCSCGDHDLPGDVPLDTCHFCGAPTTCRPVIDWGDGRLYYSICHACTMDYADEPAPELSLTKLYVPVDLAPPELVTRAYAFSVRHAVLEA